MDFDQRLRHAVDVAGRIADWDAPHFAWHKAYVASAFSLAAYEPIPQFELADAERAKLIPCDAYQAAYASASLRAARRFMQEEGETSFFIIVRERVVVVIAKTTRCLFIALRGTTVSYADFAADLDLRRVSVPAERQSLVRLHRGFFEAVASCLPEVVNRCAERLGTDAPVYVTGHSLGGAMAAIMNAQLLKGAHWSLARHGRRRYPDLLPTACYAFGMPRYGNRHAVAQLPWPYHVYNERDIVPVMPPDAFGFADLLDNYCLTADGKLLRPHSPSGSLGPLFGRRTQALGVAEHRMERYVERVEAAYRKGLS